MFCTQCGGQLPEGSGFCHKCGAKVVRADTVQQTPAPAAAPIPSQPQPQTPAAPVAANTPTPSASAQAPPTDTNGAAITEKALELLKANMSRCSKIKDVSISIVPKGLVAKGKVSNHTVSFPYGDVHVESKLKMMFTIISWAIIIGLWILIRVIAEENSWDEVTFWLVWVPCIILDYGLWKFIVKREAKVVHPFIFDTLEPLQSEDGVQTHPKSQ